MTTYISNGLSTVYNFARETVSAYAPSTLGEKAQAAGAVATTVLGAAAFGVPGALVFGGSALAGYAMGRDPKKPKETVPPDFTRVLDKLTEDTTPSSLIPFAGIAAGAATALAERALVSSFSDKNRAVCKTVYDGLPALKAINGLKQWEIKNFALLSAVMPLLAKIGVDAIRSNENGIANKLLKAFKNNITKEQLVSLALIASLGFTNGLYANALGITSKTFDSSGHMMIKVLVASFLGASIGAIQKNGGRTAKILSTAFGAISALADVPFVHNTVRNCHTVAESAAGLGWGAAILALPKAISRLF